VRPASPTYGASGPTYALVSSTALEYQLCLKCHSGYTQLPSNAGLPPSRFTLDKGVEFDPANLSFHPVEAAGTNDTPAMELSLGGPSPFKRWSFTTDSTIRCVNCHADPQALAEPTPVPADASLPVHASVNRGILIAAYKDRELKGPIDDYAAADFAPCYLCHAEAPFRDVTGNERLDTNFRYHGVHVSGDGLLDHGSAETNIDTASAGGGLATCAECHFRIHSTSFAVNGQPAGSRLVNFAPNVTAPTGGTITWRQKSATQTGTCAIKCHAQTTGPILSPGRRARYRSIDTPAPSTPPAAPRPLSETCRPADGSGNRSNRQSGHLESPPSEGWRPLRQEARMGPRQTTPRIRALRRVRFVLPIVFVMLVGGTAIAGCSSADHPTSPSADTWTFTPDPSAPASMSMMENPAASEGNGLTLAVANDAWEHRPGYTHVSPATEAAYAYALHNPHVVQWFPCYCGCGGGHRSNLDCYFKPTTDGTVAEEHACTATSASTSRCGPASSWPRAYRCTMHGGDRCRIRGQRAGDTDGAPAAMSARRAPSATLERRPEMTSKQVERELLGRLGLSVDANTQDLERAHDGVIEFLGLRRMSSGAGPTARSPLADRPTYSCRIRPGAWPCFVHETLPSLEAEGALATRKVAAPAETATREPDADGPAVPCRPRTGERGRAARFAAR
jgi:hypothetical protein